MKNNQINHTEKSRGINGIMKLLEQNKLSGCFIADEIIGRGAAMIFVAGGVKACYGLTMSKGALELLEKQGIKATYATLTDSIINRQGTGPCPMESAIADITDTTQAIVALKEALAALQNK